MSSVKELFEKMELNSDQIEKPLILEQWLLKHNSKLSSFVNGKVVSEGTVKNVVSPSGIKYDVVCASQKIFKSALEVAKGAQDKWIETDYQVKSRHLYSIARTFQKHVSLFATAEAVAYPYKRIERCKGAWASRTTEYLYLGISHCERNQTSSPRCKAMVVTQWSDFFSMNLVSEWKIVEALTNDTPVVLTVSSRECLPAILFVELCSIAGLPSGLLNVVVMGDEDLNSIKLDDDCLHHRLTKKSPYASICVILEGADYHSAISGAIEMLADCVGSHNHLGLSLYVQESIKKQVMTVLDNQIKNVKTVSSNLMKTIDMVSDSGVQIVHTPHITEEMAGGAPKIFVQTFRTAKEVSTLVSSGTLHSDNISIWTEQVGVAIEIAHKITGYRHVWINCLHLYSSAVDPFEELSYPSGQKGNFEGKIFHSNPAVPDVSVEHRSNNIDRTLKLYYGGSQKRAESNTSYPVFNKFPPFDIGDKILAYVPCGGPKDVRNAVECAVKAVPGWKNKSAFNRSQILYFFGENLSQRRQELIEKSSMNTGLSDFEYELQGSIDSVFKWAGHCDGEAPSFTSTAGFKVYSSHEPFGVIGIVCPPTKSLRTLLTLLTSAIAIGNTVVLIVPEEYPIAPLMLAQVIETSDIPAGVINILCGPTKDLLTTLAKHHDVSALWCWSHQKSDELEEACVSSRKQKVWWFNVDPRNPTDWSDNEVDSFRGFREFVWIPCKSIFAN